MLCPNAPLAPPPPGVTGQAPPTSLGCEESFAFLGTGTRNRGLGHARGIGELREKIIIERHKQRQVCFRGSKLFEQAKL